MHLCAIVDWQSAVVAVMQCYIHTVCVCMLVLLWLSLLMYGMHLLCRAAIPFAGYHLILLLMYFLLLFPPLLLTVTKVRCHHLMLWFGNVLQFVVVGVLLTCFLIKRNAVVAAPHCWLVNRVDSCCFRH